MSKLVLKNLFKRYDDNIIINDLSVSIDNHQFIVILGPSGSGKTTILKLLSGFINLDKGLIFLDDKLINNLKPKDRDIGYVFQEYSLFNHLNVYQNIIFGLDDNNDLKNKVLQLTKDLNINNYLDRQPYQLSGGQKQRVSIAQALIRDPKILLMDEPFSSLDHHSKKKAMQELLTIHNKLQNTIIYVTHDQEEAMRLADQILILNDGNIEQFDTPYNIYQNPTNIFVASLFDEFNILDKNKLDIEINDGYQVGIRPNDLHIKNVKDHCFKAIVTNVHYLGLEYIIYLDNTIKIHSLIEYPINSELTLYYNLDSLLIFDEDGNRCIY